MKRRAFLRHLAQHGCVIVREGGKHTLVEHTTKHTRSAVPRHTEIKDRLTEKICDDLGVPRP